VYNWRIAEYHTYYVSAAETSPSLWAHNVGGCNVGSTARNNPGEPFPSGAQPGQILDHIDPNSLQAGRPVLDAGRLAEQERLIQQGIPRATPIQVTPAGVIYDGNHGARAAAQAGVPVRVEVVPPWPIQPQGPVMNLPVLPKQQ
jgi:hypothetical protein